MECHNQLSVLKTNCWFQIPIINFKPDFQLKQTIFNIENQFEIGFQSLQSVLEFRIGSGIEKRFWSW